MDKKTKSILLVLAAGAGIFCLYRMYNKCQDQQKVQELKDQEIATATLQGKTK